MVNFIKQIDIFYNSLILEQKCQEIDYFIQVFEAFGNWKFIIPLLFILLYALKQDLKHLAIDSLIFGILVLVLKILFYKARPSSDLYGFFGPSLDNNDQFYSFISGDVIVVLLFYHYLKPIVDNMFLFFLVLIVSFGRLYSNGHYITDICVSFIIFDLYYISKSFVLNLRKK